MKPLVEDARSRSREEGSRARLRPLRPRRRGFRALVYHSMGHCGGLIVNIRCAKASAPFLALISKPSVFADSDCGEVEARELKKRPLPDVGG